MRIDRPTELRRLAKVMHKSEKELAYLDDLDGTALQRLRQALQASLLDRFADLFERMAAGGKIAPDALSALLCKKVFGPTLTANMSYYTPTDKSVKMSKHFSDDFLTEIAREQIPERAQEQLEKLPVDLMRPVTRNLLAMKDYSSMGGFMDYMPEDKIITLMEEVKDPADHLRVSSFAQRKDRVARIATTLDDETIKRQIEVAYSDADFIMEVGLVASEMDAANQQRMARLTDEVNPDYREKSREMARQAGLEDQLQAFFAA